MVTTEYQDIVINKALEMLKKDGNYFITLGSSPGKGKTTTAILLLDNIGQDKNLLELFTQLQERVHYLDAGVDSSFLTRYLTNKKDFIESLIVIDNIHKLSVKKLTDVLNKINSISKYTETMQYKNLILLFYQKFQKNDSTGKILREYLPKSVLEFYYDSNENYSKSFSHVEVNKKIEHDGTLLTKIKAENYELLRTNLMNIYFYSSDNKFINFLLNALNNNCSYHNQEIDWFKFIAIIVLLSRYTGIVSSDSLIKVWQNCESTRFGKRKCCKLIEFFSKHYFLIPFSLRRGFFLFNETLAYEYKKRLFHINIFKDFYFKTAHYLHESKIFNSQETNWLFFIACEVSVCKDKFLTEREQLFYDCMENLNKDYILSALNEEIELTPEKASVFKIELGILYIQTGNWAQARKVLKPYISKEKTNSNVHELQLQIIEADHGVSDNENISMLNTIINESNNSYIKFQANYWRAHIDMERGNFSLVPWDILMNLVKENHDWKEQKTYLHFVRRLTADACRTFFLSGCEQFEYFKAVITFFYENRKRDNSSIRQEDLALEKLEKAHYLHYEIIYQLGIWQMYKFPHDKEITSNDSATREELIDTAIHLYEESINIFISTGDKAHRTALIKMDELLLCTSFPNFVEILSHLDEFEIYARENNVNVFLGYIECLRGKVFIVYALNESIQEDNAQYEHLIKLSLSALKNSIKIYEKYGNLFGVFRSKLLYTLVDVIQIAGDTESQSSVTKYLKENLNNLINSYSKNNRESYIIEYLNMLTKIRVADIGKVIKYYPIVLQ
jgi:hypothetical protein